MPKGINSITGRGHMFGKHVSEEIRMKLKGRVVSDEV